MMMTSKEIRKRVRERLGYQGYDQLWWPPKGLDRGPMPEDCKVIDLTMEKFQSNIPTPNLNQAGGDVSPDLTLQAPYLGDYPSAKPSGPEIKSA